MRRFVVSQGDARNTSGNDDDNNRRFGRHDQPNGFQSRSPIVEKPDELRLREKCYSTVAPWTSSALGYLFWLGLVISGLVSRSFVFFFRIHGEKHVVVEAVFSIVAMAPEV